MKVGRKQLAAFLTIGILCAADVQQAARLLQQLFTGSVILADAPNRFGWPMPNWPTPVTVPSRRLCPPRLCHDVAHTVPGPTHSPTRTARTV